MQRNATRDKNETDAKLLACCMQGVVAPQSTSLVHARECERMMTYLHTPCHIYLAVLGCIWQEGMCCMPLGQCLVQLILHMRSRPHECPARQGVLSWPADTTGPDQHAAQLTLSSMSQVRKAAAATLASCKTSPKCTSPSPLIVVQVTGCSATPIRC